MENILRHLFLNTILVFLLVSSLQSQELLLGADMSYVNEMEDCGVSYSDKNQNIDPFQLLSQYEGKIVRLRLWHTPEWYDDLNSGKRYSDFTDVKKSIQRVKANNMKVLLDFHLSDTWADPSSQLVPKAWLEVVDNTDVLADSVYNYFYNTLSALHQENLVPEIIQIGNETNKGILLSPQDNQTWTLDWNRNAQLFNAAIDAVNAFNAQTQSDVKTMIHAAGPQDTEWLIDGFISSGVKDFDYIGISYYWAWHKPTSINQTKNIIRSLRTEYPEYEVIVVETGYIWTNEWNDNAGNIISEVHPDYTPASPSAQLNWMVDLTQAIVDGGGVGLIYWEPFWVSSPCFTQWGQGSHQEHATFFDFDNNLLEDGGMLWMGQNYGVSSTSELIRDKHQILINTHSSLLKIKWHSEPIDSMYKLVISNTQGQQIFNDRLRDYHNYIDVGEMSTGLYTVHLFEGTEVVASQKWMRISE